MKKYEELQAQIDALTRLLEERGIRPPEEAAIKLEDRKDYIPFGSPQHAAFLGLVEVEDVEKAKDDGHIVYTSSKTGNSYRLEDQVTPFMHYSDPMQVARLVLMQKVSSFESPPPEAPPDAPPMWPLEPVETAIF